MSPDSLKAKERKARLQYMSYRDMLTTLYNRNRYIQVLEGMQAKTVIKTGVAYIDINGLKRVNDLYGHEAGDRLIINTARSMLAILPENAYRVGGDEFVLICFDMDEMIFGVRSGISVTALLLKGSVFLLALSGRKALRSLRP